MERYEFYPKMNTWLCSQRPNRLNRRLDWVNKLSWIRILSAAQSFNFFIRSLFLKIGTSFPIDKMCQVCANEISHGKPIELANYQ